MAKKAEKEDSAANKESKKGTGFTKPLKLSADLAAIVGQKQAFRGGDIKFLCAYLKKNNLQDSENKHFSIQ